MKSAQYTEFGDPLKVVSLVDIDHKELQHNEIRIKLEFSPINPADLFVIMGTYPIRPEFPTTPGSEGVGRISEIGPGVIHLKIGDVVLLPFHRGIGTWRDEMIVNSNFVTALPNDNNVELEQLAMASVNPPSALYMLRNYVNLDEGDWIIQNAANGAVGRCIIGFAKKKGLKTVNVVRRTELADELKELGADYVLVDGPDLKKRISKLTDIDNIKLGLDAVAGDATHRIAQCVAEYGTVINYGAMSMKKCEVGASQTIFRSINLVGFWYHKWTQTVTYEEYLDLTRRTNEAVLNRDIKMAVHSTFALDDIHEAMKTALGEKLNGKVLIKGNT
ncbi:MAG: zinc-dependent alcohol dehydrogenase family protein [Candidatus Heimdallarchaeota archaeon]|nr:zinc-dependent alcohol dehydrogenase family protein [Candidatus Heimdallarchaeota archaeon]